jgi:hypothetical protein
MDLQNEYLNEEEDMEKTMKEEIEEETEEDLDYSDILKEVYKDGVQSLDENSIKDDDAGNGDKGEEAEEDQEEHGKQGRGVNYDETLSPVTLKSKKNPRNVAGPRKTTPAKVPRKTVPTNVPQASSPKSTSPDNVTDPNPTSSSSVRGQTAIKSNTVVSNHPASGGKSLRNQPLENLGTFSLQIEGAFDEVEHLAVPKVVDIITKRIKFDTEQRRKLDDMFKDFSEQVIPQFKAIIKRRGPYLIKTALHTDITSSHDEFGRSSRSKSTNESSSDDDSDDNSDKVSRRRQIPRNTNKGKKKATAARKSSRPSDKEKTSSASSNSSSNKRQRTTNDDGSQQTTARGGKRPRKAAKAPGKTQARLSQNSGPTPSAAKSKGKGPSKQPTKKIKNTTTQAGSSTQAGPSQAPTAPLLHNGAEPTCEGCGRPDQATLKGNKRGFKLYACKNRKEKGCMAYWHNYGQCLNAANNYKVTDRLVCPNGTGCQQHLAPATAATAAPTTTTAYDQEEELEDHDRDEEEE